MKNFVLAFFFIFTSVGSFAQYKSAVGARFDGTPSLSVKFNKNSKLAFEGLLAGFGSGLKGTGLVEIHQPAFNSSSWRTYVGFGGHLGAVTPYVIRRNDIVDPKVQIGVDGILGIEHTFSEIPLNFSLDWKPEFNFTYRTGLYLPSFGLGLRYAIR